MNGKWKKILIALLFLPIMAFFPACSCSESNNTTPQQSAKEHLSYTIHFYTGTESSFNIPNQIVQYGGLVREPSEDPVRAGYTFVGWFKDSSCTAPWTFLLDTVESDMTLYAGWQKRQY